MSKVSVIIPTYNRVNLICDAVDSVLNQTFKDWEIIVVDDGSTDNTREVLGKYTSIIYVYQENKGRAEARNIGAKLAKGEYIAFLDDDDIWLPHKLKKQVDYLNSHPGICLVHAFIEVVNEEGRLLPKETKKQVKLYRKAMKLGYTYEGMSQLCLMFTSTVMVRRACLDKIGLFDSRVEAFEDWDFYLRFALKYPIATIPDALVNYRIHKAQTTRDEFTRGRINLSMKHLAILESRPDFPNRDQMRHNLYIQLANAYYIDMQLPKFRVYALKALKSHPSVLFRSRLGLQFLASLTPFIIQARHKLKILLSRKTPFYPERIIPEETFGGPLAAHLKRYNFAKPFCIDKVVLDAACGVGYGTYYLAEAALEAVGIDAHGQAVNYAKAHYQRENIRFKVMDVSNLEFPDNYFDVICSFETLEHLDDPEKYIAEARRVLVGDGLFIVSTPYVKNTTHNPKNPYHRVEFSRSDFQAILEKYFKRVEIFGQRRLQSNFHYYLQKIDVFYLRAILPRLLIRKFCHTAGTRSWDEADAEDFVVSKDNIKRAGELIGVCYKSDRGWK